jgi:hypothetical protein
MTSLRSNLVKRIERLPKPTNVAGAMQPLFEAVSNSIHSTQERFKENVATLGRIIVDVTTDRRKKNVIATVEDNGVGLTDRHWESFITTDSDTKIQIGGKGVGRLLWLDCFQRIDIASVYLENGRKKKRAFQFVLSMEEQIQNYQTEDLDDSIDTSFFVRFSGLKDNGYFDKFPGRGSFIFQHFTSHFLPVFIGGRSPRVEVSVGGETKFYPEAIDAIVYRKSSDIDIETESYGMLKITLMECDKIASSDLKGYHFVHFIAHDRTVHSQAIDGKLGLKYFGSGDSRVFHAIVRGEFLDKNVNQERTAFLFEDAIIERIINDTCINYILEFLTVPISKLKEEQLAQIEEITESYPSVSFGSAEELQSKIPSGELSADAIFGHLSRERFRRDQRQGERIRSVLKKLRDGRTDINSFSAAIADAGKALEEAEQRSLAEYVVRRKVVLDFIEILLEKVRDDARDSSYNREDVLHSFICPLRVTTLASGDKKVEPAASHDLWIVDERLTFAEYFSSDVEFSKLSAAVGADERADLLIFDYIHGLRQTEQPSKVLLVEFKRPGRTAYNDEENPQFQVQRYIRHLLTGGQIDVRGRPIKLDSNTIFYCFIVADIIGKLDDWTFSWQRTTDGRGRRYQPNEGFRGSIEVIGWDALLSDARARNQAFFDKAGLSGRSYFSVDK